jgi:hypothetical protein
VAHYHEGLVQQDMRLVRSFLFIFLCMNACCYCEDFTIGRLKYSGGGDWYANPTSIPNWLRSLQTYLGMRTLSGEQVVSLKDDSAWTVPILYATGHGNIDFDESEAETLRTYLLSGGFLWVDDNYGMNSYFRRNIRKVFPQKKLLPIGSDHLLYRSFFKLKGLPKVHEHDGEPAQGFGLFDQGRMIVFYSYSSDIGDGLEDADVHKDSQTVRKLAEQFAVNLVYFVLN